VVDVSCGAYNVQRSSRYILAEALKLWASPIWSDQGREGLAVRIAQGFWAGNFT
jgi:hypothetical protein